MYDMYPEWGPTRDEAEHPVDPPPRSRPVQESMNLRDRGGERPDDD